MLLLCRNRVEDFARWRAVFAADEAAQAEAGLRLERLWRDADDPQQVWFVLHVADRDRAEAFMASPASARAGRAAGVLDGEVHFLEPA